MEENIEKAREEIQAILEKYNMEIGVKTDIHLSPLLSPTTEATSATTPE